MNERLRNNEIYGMQPLFDRLYADSRNGSNFYHLYEHIVSRNNILLAYRNVRISNGVNTSGVDGVTMSVFDKMPGETLVALVQKRLQNHQPGWVKRCEIPNKFGEVQPIGIQTMLDRIISQCFLQVLDPIAEAKFYRHSYGYRPCRSAIHALSRAVSLVNRGKMYYCVDVSIRSFFDEVDHNELIRQLWAFGIRDKQVISVIRKILHSPICGAGILSKGIVQCGVLSGIFTNIYLDKLDHWIETQWEQFPVEGNIHSFHNGTARRSTDLKSGYIVRYADSIKIFCRSYDHALRFYHAVRQYVEEHLHLCINEDGSGVVNLKKKNIDFLGFQIKAVRKESTKNGWYARTKLSDAAVDQISRRLKGLISKIQYHSFDGRYVQEYNAAVAGFKNYYQYATDVYCDLDRIGMSVVLVMKNRLKDRGHWSTCGEQSDLYHRRNVGVHNATKVMVVQGIPFDIINGISHRSPMNFKQATTPYTKEGRVLMAGEMVRIREDYLKYIADVSYNNLDFSVEYLNNRLSKYMHQKGVCAVFGIQFHPKDMECHHIMMKKRNSQGGTDDFRNLVWLHKDIHKLIHLVDDALIRELLELLKLTEKQLGKVNEYRLKIGNTAIACC